jgi:hypothetical protein
MPTKTTRDRPEGGVEEGWGGREGGREGGWEGGREGGKEHVSMSMERPTSHRQPQTFLP